MSSFKEARNFDDDEEEDDESQRQTSDRIRRSYNNTANQEANRYGPSSSWNSNVNSTATNSNSAAFARQSGGPETIQVTLNESYFANERRLLINSLANVRQKLNSLQMFNPAKNEHLKQRQQEEWSEKEKYTLDSLNEFKGQLDERFQWSRPEDGREVWSSKTQYFLAITSYSIGLGNVIRFPILVQKNGGLAFIIPFVIMLLLEGIPLFYLELAIGQRMRKAAISCWHSVSPFAAGIGLASAAVSFLVGLYYNTMVAWTLIYSWSSLTNKFARLAQCPGDAGDQAVRAANTNAGDNLKENATTNSETSGECQLAGPFEYHWFRETLDVTRDVSDWSHFNWAVALCLALAWLISYICLVKGLSSSKRLVYIISIFPYVILVIFLFKSINLRGMGHGVRYLLEPDWPKLIDPYVWLQAAAQVFFSLGLGFGGLIALSSYNSINNNCYRDAIKVTLINFLTSILAGLVIFSILGFKAGLNYDKCQLEREQQIDFYLSDYNLKALDYGGVFKQVPLRERALGEVRLRRQAPQVDESSSVTSTKRPREKAKPKERAKTKAKEEAKTKSKKQPAKGRESGEKIEASDKVSRRKQAKLKPALGSSLPADSVSETNETLRPGTKLEPPPLPVVSDEAISESGQANKGEQNLDKLQLDAEPSEEPDEFSADDAIASIKNLDRQLDSGLPSGSFDYGDSDVKFELNASNLISRADLEQIIGNINNLQNCSIRRELEESTRGTGLVFVAMAEAISQFDSNDTGPFHLSASTWAILFFLMILALGLDSQFGNLEGLLSSLTDLNFFHLNSAHNQNGRLTNGATHSMAPHQQPGSPTPSARTIVTVRQGATGFICVLSFVISLGLFAHGAGSYMFAIFDEYASNFSLVLIALFELLAISHIYGLKRFCDDCELMTGKRPPFMVLLSWRYISPILLLLIVCTSIKQFALELNYDVWLATSDSSDHIVMKPWPTWSIIFGALLIISCVIWIPLMAVLRIMRVHLIPEDQQQQRCWFPAEELKEFHQLQDQEHQVTKLERLLFGFRQDDD